MVSIIIPAYNVEMYIRECLDSALGQTFTDLEVIVVDDGSTDSTPEIIHGYAERDSRVRVLRRPNGGLPIARNPGLEMARGEWVMFLDSDDVLSPYAVAVLLEAASRSGTSFVEARWTEGPDTSRIRWADTPAGLPTVFGQEAYIEKVLYQDGACPSVCGKIFARSLFDSGLRFREGILYEDLDIFYLLAEKAGKTALIPDCLYFYRKNPVSVTGCFSPRRFDVLEVTERMEKHMALHHPALLPAARDRRLSAAFNMFGLIAANDPDGRYAPVADECWRLIRAYRRESLLSLRVRLKNKLGIVLSYLGRGAFGQVSRRFYEGRIR